MKVVCPKCSSLMFNYHGSAIEEKCVDKCSNCEYYITSFVKNSRRKDVDWDKSLDILIEEGAYNDRI